MSVLEKKLNSIKKIEIEKLLLEYSLCKQYEEYAVENEINYDV